MPTATKTAHVTLSMSTDALARALSRAARSIDSLVWSAARARVTEFNEARAAGMTPEAAARWVRYLEMKAERGEEPITLAQAVAQRDVAKLPAWQRVHGATP